MLKFLIITLLACITPILCEYTAADCRELGFIKSQLMCSSCDKLDDFGLEAIKPHCTACCTPDLEPVSQQLYPKAILEVCTCKFRAYPQIQAFIQSARPSKYPNLQIKYVRGLDPMIKLLDAKDKVVETLSITKWNTDTVDEFFDTHLIKTDSAATTSKPAAGVVEPTDVDDEDEDDYEFLRTNLV